MPGRHDRARLMRVALQVVQFCGRRKVATSRELAERLGVCQRTAIRWLVACEEAGIPVPRWRLHEGN